MTECPTDGIKVFPDTRSRIKYVRDKLFDYELGNKATLYIVLLLDEIERDIHVSRLLPPEVNNGCSLGSDLGV